MSSKKRKPKEDGARPKKRGKSDEQKAFDKNHVYSTVQVRLNTALNKHDPVITEAVMGLFKRCAENISRISLEAYFLANYHVVRLLSEKKPIPTLNQSFFKSCCVLVSKTVRGGGDDELRQSMAEYQQLRPEEFVVPENEGMSHLMASLAREMATMTKNHIIMNVLDRVIRYVRLRYNLTSKAQARAFIRSTFMDPERFLCDDQKEFRRWIELDPRYVDEGNMNHFIVKLRDILAYYKTLDPMTKGTKTFTLLPKKSDYVTSFIMIDETTLPQILGLLDVPIQERIVRTLLSQCSPGDDEEFLQGRLESHAIFCQKFQSRKEVSHALWNLLFDRRRFETENRKFKCLMTTNGYAATMYLQKPKSLVKPSDESGFHSVPKTFDKYETLIGIDPGITYVASAYARPKVDTTPETGKSHCIQVSTKEIRHESKMHERRKWDSDMRKNNPEYTAAIGRLPSLKTCDLAELRENLRLTLIEAGYLFDFCKPRAFLGWRFKVSVYGKKAMCNAAKKILNGKDPSKTIIGFGDWSQQDGMIKGLEKAPVKRIRKQLRKSGARVIRIDEYRTSKVCSKCCCSLVENVSYMKKGRMTKCHQAVRCRNNDCSVYWQRDINASRNMHFLLREIVEGRMRSAALCRGSRFTDAGKLVLEVEHTYV